MSEFSGTIVDVRTRAEFSGGHVAHSVNIPLQEIMDHVDEIKQMKTPIIFCCASGGRSGQATHYFKSIKFIKVDVKKRNLFVATMY
jgi:rhodanese-related sulfurtransferase